jgi:hypothetical protein
MSNGYLSVLRLMHIGRDRSSPRPSFLALPPSPSPTLAASTPPPHSSPSPHPPGPPCLATVPPRASLLHEVTLRWPREASRYDELRAHSARVTKAARSSPSLAQSPGSTPRLPCQSRRFSRARVCGEGGDGAARCLRAYVRSNATLTLRSLQSFRLLDTFSVSACLL